MPKSVQKDAGVEIKPMSDVNVIGPIMREAKTYPYPIECEKYTGSNKIRPVGPGKPIESKSAKKKPAKRGASEMTLE